jgi:HAD superfamily hydrolase (TIGR01509 family)
VKDVRAVLFDYGNTLVEFSHRQIDALDRALLAFLRERFGPVEESALRDARDRDRRAPYLSSEYRENDLTTMSAALVRELYGREARDGEIGAIIEFRRRSFVEMITLESSPESREVLSRLAGERPLALVSNYPDGDAIRESLDHVGLAHYFSSIVVSGDLGRVKPHSAPFERALEELGCRPDEVVHVGDNWLADIQGAKRLGMAAVWMSRWEAPEGFRPDPGDHAADATIAHLAGLVALVDGTGGGDTRCEAGLAGDRDSGA